MNKCKIAGWLAALVVVAVMSGSQRLGAADEQPKPSKAKKPADGDAGKPGPDAKGIKVVKTVKLPGRPVAVFIEKARLYVAAEEKGAIVIHIFDIENAFDPKPLGNATIGHGVLIASQFREGRMFVRDGIACICQCVPEKGSKEAEAFNKVTTVSDEEPATPGKGKPIKEAAAKAKDQVVVVDVSDPAKPRRVAAYDTAGSPSEVWITPKKMALATSWGGPLHLVDLKDPKEPRKIMDVPPPIGVFGNGKRGPERYGSSVVVDGDVAYAVWWLHGILMTVNIADPANAKPLGEYRSTYNGGWAHRVLVAGNRAYLATDQFASRVGGIQALDISNPAQPKFLSYFSAKDYGGTARKWTRNLAISGSALYVTDYNFGVVKIDVSRPEAMKKMAELETEDARGIAAGQGVVYLAAKGGILVLDAK